MAIQFRRSWWKPWDWSTRTWLVTIFACVVASPFVLRWICLWQVPDVTLPFDVDKVIPVNAPDSVNPFIGYQSAIKKLHRHETSWSKTAIEDATETFDTKWDDRLDQWLIDVKDVLADFLQSSEIENAGVDSLRTAHNYTSFPQIQELHALAKLSEAEAIRLERSGEFEEAWNWHRATFRSGHHCEIYGFTLARNYAIKKRGLACLGIARWATQPSLTVDRLRSARKEVVTEASKRRPPSDTSKVDYLIMRNTLNRLDGPYTLLPNWDSSSPFESQLLVLKHFLLWTTGQPELSLRLARQLHVNNASQLKLPLHLRQTTLRKKDIVVFECDPKVPRLWGQLSAAQLNAHFDTAFGQVLIEQILHQGGRADLSARWDDARLAAIDVLLACHEFQRIHGEFPANIEQLAPTFLDAIPLDPMDPTGASLRYRRDENGEAVVWSIGRDAKDDGGDIEGKEPKDAGNRIFLKKAKK